MSKEEAATLVKRMEQVPPLGDCGEFEAVISDMMRATVCGKLTIAEGRAVLRAARRKGKQGEEALAAMKRGLA